MHDAGINILALKISLGGEIIVSLRKNWIFQEIDRGISPSSRTFDKPGQIPFPRFVLVNKLDKPWQHQFHKIALDSRNRPI